MPGHVRTIRPITTAETWIGNQFGTPGGDALSLVARQICHGMGTGEGYLRLGSPGRKRTHPKTDIEVSKCDFGPTSVISCHNIVGAIAYLRRKRESKVKQLSVPKQTRAKYYQ
jgi:hypothetical protein